MSDNMANIKKDFSDYNIFIRLKIFIIPILISISIIVISTYNMMRPSYIPNYTTLILVLFCLLSFSSCFTYLTKCKEIVNIKSPWFKMSKERVIIMASLFGILGIVLTIFAILSYYN